MSSVESKVSELSDSEGIYRLYPTKNIYTFLKLNTRTGQIHQVQWFRESEKEFSMPLNMKDLSSGRHSKFELYPTQNIYTFLLLDKSDGRMWHVQWSTDAEYRWISQIKEAE